MNHGGDMKQGRGVLMSEMALWFGARTSVVFLVWGQVWGEDLSNTWWYAFLFGWVFVSMLWLAFGVVRHADALAILLGEPYGTMVLTLSVISIEVVMIAAVMITGAEIPTLGRYTLFYVLLIGL